MRSRGVSRGEGRCGARRYTDWQAILLVSDMLGSPLAIPPALEGFLCCLAKCKKEPCLSLEVHRERDWPEWPQGAKVAAAGWIQQGRGVAPQLPVASSRMTPPRTDLQPLQASAVGRSSGAFMAVDWSGGGVPQAFSPGARSGQAGTPSPQGTPADDGAAAG